jgi:hypothetical protein
MLEHIHQRFPHFPRHLDDQATNLIVEMMYDDQELARRVAMNRPSLDDCRKVAESVMTAWAANALDAVRAEVERLDPDDITHFFKIQTFYEGVGS